MSYQLELQRPNLLYFRLYGALSIEEVRALAQGIDAVFAQTSYSIHMIGDMTDLVSYPTSLGELRQLGSITVSPYVGSVAIITRHKLVYFMIASVISMFISHVDMRPVLTRDAALAFIDAGSTRPLVERPQVPATPTRRP